MSQPKPIGVFARLVRGRLSLSAIRRIVKQGRTAPLCFFRRLIGNEKFNGTKVDGFYVAVWQVREPGVRRSGKENASSEKRGDTFPADDRD